MKYLITGGRGFISRNLQIHLMSQNHQVCSIWRDGLKNLQTSNDTITKYQPDVIVHLAADPYVKSVNIDSHFPLTLSILNWIKQNALPTYRPIFIYASSATLFGNCDIPKNETNRVNPSSIYSVCKLSCEHLVELFTKSKVIRGVSIRAVANVGKHSTHGILHDFVRKLQSDSPTFKLIGKEPGTIKPFIHVRDACRIIEFIVDKHIIQDRPINVAPPDTRPLSALEVANITMSELGITKPIEWVDETWEGDDNRLEIVPDTLMKHDFKWLYPDSISAIKGAVKDMISV